jgi:hypothetical protein
MKSFEAVWTGAKRHEVRRFDRPYAEGDAVVLLEYEPSRAEPGRGWYGGRVIAAMITNLTPPESFGLPAGLCCFSLGSVACGYLADPRVSRKIATDALHPGLTRNLPDEAHRAITRAWMAFCAGLAAEAQAEARAATDDGKPLRLDIGPPPADGQRAAWSRYTVRYSDKPGRELHARAAAGGGPAKPAAPRAAGKRARR